MPVLHFQTQWDHRFSWPVVQGLRPAKFHEKPASGEQKAVFSTLPAKIADDKKRSSAPLKHTYSDFLAPHYCRGSATSSCSILKRRGR
jgi:hypothetical protein